MFWGLRDHLGEARSWIDQVLPTADSWEPHAQAELLWTAAVTALEVVGEDHATLATSQRLESLLARIRDDPYLHTVSQLAIVGIATEFAAGVRLNRQQAIAAVRDPRSTSTAAS